MCCWNALHWIEVGLGWVWKARERKNEKVIKKMELDLKSSSADGDKHQIILGMQGSFIQGSNHFPLWATVTLYCSYLSG